jgi:Mrp family chromosome partitioning ATPase
MVTKSKNSQEEKNRSNLGRLVLVTGDKGGTGKSVVARALLDIYRHQKINCIAYECDQSNPQLFRHYNSLPPGIKTLKLNERGGADALQDDLKELSPKVSLVDLPAGAADYFEGIAKDISLFRNADKLGYKITMVSVLGRVKDSVVQLKRLLEFCGSKTDYVVVKNLYWGSDDKFSRYNNSKTRQALKDLGGIELLFPELYDDLFDLVDGADLTFREATDHEALTLSNQSRLFDWIDGCEMEFLKAKEFLGL